jgi:uncharacterized protein YjbI with pentapeptide repeats
MKLKNVFGEVIFALEGAKTVFELITAAVAAKKSLNDANLDGANLINANLDGANLRGASLVGASQVGASLDGANLDGANLDGAILNGKKIKSMRIFSGLYRYTVHAVLFQDGSRWVRMGCLWKSLEDWEIIGIRKSNESEFPDDGSESCEERVAAFEFAKAAALRMK